MDASSAAIRSGTSSGSSSGGAETSISWPSALRSIISITASRYSSRYWLGSNSVVSDSISCWAMSTSFLETLVFLPSGRSATSSGGTTSSENSIVSMARMPSRGRMATSCSFERMTTRAMPTFSEASMAS